jgi:hypothetical protein
VAWRHSRFSAGLEKLTLVQLHMETEAAIPHKERGFVGKRLRS